MTHCSAGKKADVTAANGLAYTAGTKMWSDGEQKERCLLTTWPAMHESKSKVKAVFVKAVAAISVFTDFKIWSTAFMH